MEVSAFNKINITTILAVLAGFVFYAYEYILRITPSVMEIPLSASMHVSVTVVGALSAYYYYSYISMQILVGIILDKYDLKRNLTIASLFCAIGTSLLLVSHSVYVFSIGRFIQGFGSAYAWVGIMKIAAVYLPKRFYGLATSFGAVFGFLGAAFGQAILGFLVHFYGKNITFTILSFIGFFISYFIFNELSRAQQQKLSLEYTTDKKVVATSKNSFKDALCMGRWYYCCTFIHSHYSFCRALGG